MRLLVVEDAHKLREYVVDGLEAAGYAVDAVADGRQGLIYARSTDYDAIILDLMLPELDGLELLRRFRQAKGAAPVLIISARDRVDQRIEGLRSGADDYLIKPFDFGELLARVEALCRRSHGMQSNTVQIASVKIDLAAKRVTVAGNEVDLTPREYGVLEYLFVNAGRVVSREEMEEHVYAADRQVWSNTIDSAIAAIRRKLAQHGAEGVIRTKRRYGYGVLTTEGNAGERACDH
jgi:DNA-binding response OmpR family regulator